MRKSVVKKITKMIRRICAVFFVCRFKIPITFQPYDRNVTLCFPVT